MPSNTGETIAQAYVQILPSTEGIQGQLTELLGGEVDEAGSKSGLSFAKKLVAGFVTGYAAKKIGDTIKNSLDNYSDYEQLTGGIETLFQSSADTIMEYAENAYQTAGLSANQYMETVTGFSAALIQSTGRVEQQNIEALKAGLDEEYLATKRGLEDQYDAVKRSWDERIRLTNDANEKASLRAQKEDELKALQRANEDELSALKAHNADLIAAAEAANNASITSEESLARAADLADMAITDMADNANKMGTSMESIQNAYQGFAKQNYTMLDNLKLGYGGTKEEMERLLADASKLSGVEYDISSYADIVEAIHVVQTEMGITGTTATEAAETISGSVAATKAAWQNLLTGIADENADMDALIDNFINNAVTAGENILPRIEQIFVGLLQLVSTGAGRIIPIVAETLISNLPLLLDVGIQTIFTLSDALITALPNLIPAVVEVILTIVEKLTEPSMLMNLIQAAFQIIGAVVQGLIDAIPELVSAVPTIIMNLIEAILRFLPQILASGVQLMSELALGIARGAVEVIAAIVNLLSEIPKRFMERINDAKNWGRDLVQNFINGLIEKWQALKDQVKAMAQTVKDFLGFSEPVAGPLSDFHTYAPDMVDLWNQGLRDNESKIRQQLSTTFAIGDQMRAMAPVPQYVQQTEGAAARVQNGPRQLVVVLELNRSELGRVVYDLNNEETQRVGVRLAGGVA